MNNKLTLMISLVFLAAFSRLIPHPWNFTALGAIAFFGGARFEDKKMSLWIPMLALFVSDLFLGFHSTILFTYGGFLLVGLIAQFARNLRNPITLVSLLLSSSVVFYLVSNFGVWAVENIYPKTMAGLFQCYVMGLPFFERQILSDLFYSGFLFAAYEFLNKKLLKPQVNS